MHIKEKIKLISMHSGHNSTVGLFEDGECRAILHEEKFSNVKNHFGFPERTLEYLSQLYNFNEIDYFVFSTRDQMSVVCPGNKTNIYEDLSKSKIRHIISILEYKSGFKKLFTGIRNYIFHHKVSPKAKKELESWLEKKYKITKDKIKYFDHHLCHCLTPVYFYDLNSLDSEVLLISMDGAGDYSFAKMFVYNPKDHSLNNIVNNNFDSSIGLLYSEMTKFLGMKPSEHEYKVMGLAAYVSNEKYYKHIYDKLAEIVWFNEKTLTFESKFNTNVASLYFKDYFFGERFDNLSSAIQKITENLVIRWVRAGINRTGIHTIAVSGGVFMNVKLNQKILELPEVEKVYFQPSCGDDSSIIGAACRVFLDKSIDLKQINSMYLGLKYTNDEVKQFLTEGGYFEKYNVEYIDNIELEIARLLSKFEVVARFKGAGEWGARSLSNRGILGNASDLKTFYEVNDMIKMRDFWMPFAPTILEEWADRYIQNWDMIKKKAYESTKYMILTFDSTELSQKHLRAAIHQKDKTLRPQIVSKYDNEDLYMLLKHYEELTGMGGIMNTSLNLHGYPLVGTLEQAIFTLENSGLKYMAVENFLMKKKHII